MSERSSIEGGRGMKEEAMSEQERGVERVAIAKMVTDDLATYFGRQPKRTWSGRELDRMLRQLRAEPTGIAKRLAARESQP